MAKPRGKELVAAFGISASYASDILTGRQPPSRPLAIAILREFGWRHSCIADLTAEQIAASQVLEPWIPPAERAA